MKAMGVLLTLNKALRWIGLGSEKIAEQQAQYDAIHQHIKDYTRYGTKFTEYFSPDDWVLHDSLSFDVLKEAVDTCEHKGKEAAVEVLLIYYGPEQIEQRFFFFCTVEALQDRRKFIEYALAGHKAGRHYSAIPLLLMVMDGAANAATGKGAHASSQDFDVWDSILATDGAMNTIKNIFRKGRPKTCMDPLTLPYRNGILHGMDLAYDNPIVTAKCWCYLFAVRDWLVAKQSEPERKKAYEEQTRSPSWGELRDKLKKVEKFKQAVNAWAPRSLDPDAIAMLNASRTAAPGSPESTALEFLALWKKKNYGHMAKLFSTMRTGDQKDFVRVVRADYEFVALAAYTILGIVERAAAITEIDVSITEADGGAKTWIFRLIHETATGDPVPANLEGGEWRIVSVAVQQ